MELQIGTGGLLFRGTKLPFEEIDRKYGRTDLEYFFQIQKSAIDLVENILDKKIENNEKEK